MIPLETQKRAPTYESHSCFLVCALLYSRIRCGKVHSVQGTARLGWWVNGTHTFSLHKSSQRIAYVFFVQSTYRSRYTKSKYDER